MAPNNFFRHYVTRESHSLTSEISKSYINYSIRKSHMEPLRGGIHRPTEDATIPSSTDRSLWFFPAAADDTESARAPIFPRCNEIHAARALSRCNSKPARSAYGQKLQYTPGEFRSKLLSAPAHTRPHTRTLTPSSCAIYLYFSLLRARSR